MNLFTHETESPSSFEQVERWLKQQIWKLCTYLEELCVSDNDQVANTALLIGATLSAQFQAWRVLFQRQVITEKGCFFMYFWTERMSALDKESHSFQFSGNRELE